MYIGSCYEEGIEGEFVFSPLMEMLNSLHVLCGPEHHLERLEWSKEAKDKIEPELFERIYALKEKTNEWLIVMDFIQEGIYENIDILDGLMIIEKLSLLKWNRVFSSYGKKITLEEKGEVLQVLRQYYLEYFQSEIKLLQPFIIFRLRKELVACKEQGLMNYIAQIHERIEVQQEVIICHKNKDYRIEKASIHKVQISATTFINPHLLLGHVDKKICLTKLISVKHKRESAPEDLVRKLKALGDNVRLQILREIKYKPLSTQELAKIIKISEAGVSKHLKMLYEAGIVNKERKGNYINYSLQRDTIDYIPYNIYEYMMNL